MTPPLFHTNFGVRVPFWLDRPCRVGVSPIRKLKLISRDIIFEVFKPMWQKHTWTSQTDRQTDGRTDRQTDDIGLYCGITALCVASGGKNASETRWMTVELVGFSWEGTSGTTAGRSLRIKVCLKALYDLVMHGPCRTLPRSITDRESAAKSCRIVAIAEVRQTCSANVKSSFVR